MLRSGFYDKNKLGASLLAAFLFSATLYGFSWMFFAPEFSYTVTQGVIAVVSSVIGVGIIQKFFLSKTSHF